MVTIPQVRLPIEGLLRSIKLGGEEDDRIFEQAAEAQIEEERESEGAFMTFLDWLGRPQRAVAGVIKDLIDGGNFNPFDRVGQALMGNERFGIKDVIDEIAPGDWGKVKLPDWLGGKDVDLLKESIGFLGDVLTDPLNQVRIFSLTSKFRNVDKGAQAVAKKWMPKVAGEELKLGKRLRRRVQGLEEGKIGATIAIQQNIVHDRETVAHLRGLFKEMADDPEAYMKQHLAEKGWGQQVEFLEDIAPYMGKKEYAAATITDQFKEGQRKMLSFKIPFISEQLGIKDISLIPAIDKQMGEAIASGIGKMYEGLILGNETMAHMVKGFQNILRHSSGNSLIDVATVKAMGKLSSDSQIAEKTMYEIREMLTPFTKAQQDDIRDYLERPLEYFGLVWREVPKKYQTVVQKMRNVYADLLDKEKKAGLEIWGQPTGVVDQKTAYNWMLKKMKKEKPGMEEHFYSYAALRKHAEKKASDLFEGSEAFGMLDEAEQKALRGKVEAVYLKNYVDAELAKAGGYLEDTIPLGYTGYFPRNMTEDARSILDNLISNPAIRYKGASAYDFFLKHAKHRSFREHTIDELNDLFMNGGLPHDYFEKVIDQVRTSLKTRKQKKMWGKLMEAVGPVNMHLFIDDIMQATTIRMTSSLKATSNAERLRHIVSLTSRRLEKDEVQTLGESAYILSPKGMEAVYGKAWRSKLAPAAREAYEALLKDRRLKTKNSVSDLFVNADSIISMSQAKAAGKYDTDIPLFSLPNSTAEEISKVVRAYEDPEQWNTFLNGFDAVTNLWRATTLAPFLGYHLRNFVGNFWQSHIGGTFHLNNYTDAWKFQKASGKWKEGRPFGRPFISEPSEALENIKVPVEGSDLVYSGNEVLEYGNRYNIWSGLYGAELAEMSKKKLTGIRESMLKKIGKQATHKGVPLRTLFYGGQAIEGAQRTAHFIGRLRLGDTPFEAAMSVKKYFGDFENLTRFEKNVARRAFPFYSWSRHNLPLQLEALALQPAKYNRLGQAIELFQSKEGKEFDRSLLPKWVSENLGIPTRINKKTGDVEVSILRSWIPAGDLMAVVHKNPVHAMFRQATSMVHPIPKTLLELHTNQSFYTERPIKEFGMDSMEFLGKPMDKRTVHILKNIRALSEIDKAFFPKESATGKYSKSQRLVNALGIAPKVKTFNVERLKERKKFDIVIEKSKLKRVYNKAKKHGDVAMMRHMEEMMRASRANAN